MATRQPVILMAAKSGAAMVKYEDFNFKMLIGQGRFGKVYLAELPNKSDLYAIKVIRKDGTIESNQGKYTELEKDILFSCDHPFLVNMEYLFQSETRLYFVMPFVKGGELFKIFRN